MGRSPLVHRHRRVCHDHAVSVASQRIRKGARHELEACPRVNECVGIVLAEAAMRLLRVDWAGGVVLPTSPHDVVSVTARCL
jgi:hypothetical protein